MLKKKVINNLQKKQVKNKSPKLKMMSQLRSNRARKVQNQAVVPQATRRQVSMRSQ